MAEWRVGRKLGRTLYRDEVCVGMVDTPEIAAEIVEALQSVESARRVWERIDDGRVSEWTNVGDPPRDHIAGVTGCGCSMCRDAGERRESGRERSPNWCAREPRDCWLHGAHPHGGNDCRDCPECPP